MSRFKRRAKAWIINPENQSITESGVPNMESLIPEVVGAFSKLGPDNYSVILITFSLFESYEI
jgi:hypothetical protein